MAYTMKGSPMQRNFGIGSPLKGKGDNLKRIMTEKKDAAKKAGTYYKPGAAPNVPKAPKATTKMATDFNLENKKAQNVKLAKVNKKSTLSRVTKAFKDTPKQLAKGKKFAKKALKIGGRSLGLASLGVMAYDAYKSGQKHSGGKAFKGQKTGVVTPKKSIYDKPKK